MIITLDFETEKIVGNPIVNPPKPVGLAVKIDDGEPVYYTDPWAMQRAVNNAMESDAELLFHNAAFDLSVIRAHFGNAWPTWQRVHDTMFLLFLRDPHSQSLALKEAGMEVLSIKPDEQTDLKSWVLENVPQATKFSWGAWISKAPIELVEPYAKQDVELTYQLFTALQTYRGEAYDRERRLYPHLTAATLRGVRVDRNALRVHIDLAEKNIAAAEARLRSKIGIDSLNFDSGADLLKALTDRNMVKIGDDWPLTEKTKKPKTTRSVMLEQLKGHEEIGELLAYRGAMKTVVNTFMKSWLELSEADGRLHPEWNQVRVGHGGRKAAGTRTGRLSCESPNLQNVPTSFTEAVPPGLMQIPNMRDYLLPEPGCRWVSRDFAAQEIRILAHFEEQRIKSQLNLYAAWRDRRDSSMKFPGTDRKLVSIEEKVTFVSNVRETQDEGELVEKAAENVKEDVARWEPVLHNAFSADIRMDPHEKVRQLIGGDITRKQVKGIAFGLLYGMGTNALASTLDVSVDDARRLTDAYMKAVPGARLIQNWTRSSGWIVTAGGREYRAELDEEGRDRSYKLTNYLIQGSAADQTKECMIHYFEHAPEGSTFLCTVHDEINISLPDGVRDTLRDAMENGAARFLSVPMLTTLSTGDSWGGVTDEEEIEGTGGPEEPNEMPGESGHGRAGAAGA